MKILFLGTGAGEMFPATFCMCKYCKKARRQGNIMPGSSILIDNQYLVDAPTGLGLNLAFLKINVKFPFYIFITHSHQDHFDPEEIISTRDDIGNKIYLYINKTILRLLKHYTKFNRFFNFDKFKNYCVNIVKPFKPLKINKDAVVIPILANHDKTYNEENINYILKIKNRTILYACDTGWYCDKTWQEVKKHKLDVVILECSFLKTKTNGKNHMDSDCFLKFIDELKKSKSIDKHTQIIATHFSLHDFDDGEIARLEKQGVKIACRGMICKC